MSRKYPGWSRSSVLEIPKVSEQLKEKSEHIKTSKMEFFLKIVNGWKPLTICANILEVSQGPEHVYESTVLLKKLTQFITYAWDNSLNTDQRSMLTLAHKQDNPFHLHRCTLNSFRDMLNIPGSFPFCTYVSGNLLRNTAHRDIKS